MGKEPNRAAEMAVFARVVVAGDFSSAARALDISPSAVSRLITRLEERVGARLFTRSTRKLGLTAEGKAFHTRVVAILEEIAAAEREAGGARLPTGRIRISSSASYIEHVLAPVLPGFLKRYADIALDIIQTDAVSDLVADGTDLAIRAGPLRDSSLIARALGQTPLIVVASPRWIEAHGMPESLKGLEAGDWLGFAYPRAAGVWLSPSREGPERVRVNDGEGIRRLALAGVAPARLAGFTVAKDLVAGRLVELFPDLPAETESFHAVYVGRSEMLPERVRVFLDFLANDGSVASAPSRER